MLIKHKEEFMRRKVVFTTAMIALFVLGAQAVFADYNDDFNNALNRNNIRDIESLLSKRARQMDLTRLMLNTIRAPHRPDNPVQENTANFNKANCLDVLKLLVRYGADVNTRDFRYPLQLAVEEKQSLEVIKFLLDSGANPNLAYNPYDDRAGRITTPPLVDAFYYNNMPVVNLLLERGANVQPLLPLVGLAYEKDITLANLLLERGANGQLLLSYLSGGKPGDNQMIRQLISRGVQIRSTEGAQALRKAAEGDHLDTVKLLVENGVNVNARDDKGATAASLAYDQGNIEIYNYLKAKGAIDFEPRQATAQPAAPVQSAQPAPAQSSSSSSSASSSSGSSSSSSRPAAPTLQNGRYAWANSGSNMTMTLSNAGFINAYVGNSVVSIWQGTYRISGNQLVITVSNPTSEYAFMRGQTYTYTITGDTSFQGNGETWVRTGSF
jgi:ankyrin repeat protein